MSWANIPRAEYEQFATQFNPVKFDADAWVADREGRRHEVHRHHVEAPRRLRDVRQRVSDYDIVDATPFKQGSDEGARRRGEKAGLKFASTTRSWTGTIPSQYVDAPGKDSTAGNGKTEDARAEALRRAT